MPTLLRAKRWNPQWGRRRPTPISQFRPTMIAGIIYWYDFSDTSTITDAGSGAVSAVTDKSGASTTLTQGTAASRPITGTRTLNSRNVLDFDGTNDFLANTAFTQTQPITVFTVVRADSAAPAVAGQPLSSSSSSPLFQVQPVTGEILYFAGSAVLSGVFLDTAAHQIGAIFDGASSHLYLDGAQIAAGNPGATGYVAASLEIGGYGPVPTAAPWNGIIAEIIGYAGALSTVDRQRIEDYLRDKWALP